MWLIKLLLLLTLLIPNICFAATEFISYIGCGTGSCSGAGEEDFGSLSSWESNTDEDLTASTTKCGSWDTKSGATIANLTAVTWDSGSSSGTVVHQSDHSGTSLDQYMIKAITGGTLDDNDIVSDGTNTFTVNGTPDSCIAVAYVYNDDGNLSDTQFQLSSAVTNSTNYRKITVPEGERHNGTVSSGVKWDSTSSALGQLIDIRESYAIVEWLIGRNNASYSANNSVFFVYGSIQNVIYRNNIVYDSTNTHASYYMSGIYSNGTSGSDSVYYVNNIIYDMEYDGIRFSGTIGSNGYAYNNTSYSNGVSGMRRTSTYGTLTCKNNLAIGNATDSDVLCQTEVTNGSGDSTGQITSLVASTEWADPTGSPINLLLKSGATSIDDGTDLGTSQGSNIDILGRDRDATGDIWDLGAHEYVASGGAVIPKVFENITIQGGFYSGKAECYPNDWYAPQEAGKCKIGNKWLQRSELDLSMMN